ncbi:Putative neuropeptide Y receptor 11 [Papilio machaon]|uniref:Putative neuropeptide Y receptor 11 n=1 Tax=Papilio machaon TaxID=76193 RepID=A0A0N1INI4_PAPMA|nr:Putative neuropeptide Y receptor 11 [Papilio machaon]
MFTRRPVATLTSALGGRPTAPYPNASTKENGKRKWTCRRRGHILRGNYSRSVHPLLRRLKKVDHSMNLTLNASAKWLIEASRGIENPNNLLEKFSLNRKVDDRTSALLLTFYGILVIIGAVGNALVVISVVRKPVMRTARNMFIVNLAVSDALVCCVGTPLTLMELLTKHWPLPDWPSLCKACGAIQAISIFVSTISITAIALDRYQLLFPI